MAELPGTEKGKCDLVFQPPRNMTQGCGVQSQDEQAGRMSQMGHEGPQGEEVEGKDMERQI